MLVFKTILNTKKQRRKYNGNKCGLIPTMGSLHKGHLSLIEKALKKDDDIWVSIFINPTQFNCVKDLKKYPKNFDEDLKKIKSISNKINVFLPTESEIYPKKIESSKFNMNNLNNIFEGADRPGHFKGVLTIVSKLFEIINPNNAYFGEKDFQQLCIIKNWQKQNNIPVNIIASPTIREKNGLAMSSRNCLLSKSIRNEAGFIYKSLSECKKICRNGNEIKERLLEDFNKHKAFKLNYVACIETKSFLEINEFRNVKGSRLLISASVEGVRLIDNLALNN